MISKNSASWCAAQLFITIVTILLVGKLITLIPVMQQFELVDKFKAAEIIWFIAKLSSLIVFFLFTRYLIEAIPNNGGVLSFLKGVAEPFSVLLIMIMGQALLWHILAPFVDASGQAIYYSGIIILIVGISIWFVLRAYQNALYLIDATKKMTVILSGFIPHQLVNCEQCHAKISENALFCKQCGYKIQKPLCCPECEESISGEQSYCQSCGIKLKEQAILNK